MDMERVLKGLPWTLKNHLLILSKLRRAEDPLRIPLIHVPFWVQIHKVPIGLFSEILARQLGNFIGNFLEYDCSDLGKENRNFMRIRVQIDVRKPLRRRKQVMSTGVCSYSKRHIYVIVEDIERGVKWRLTGFYGSPYVQDRYDSWEILKRLSTGVEMPWLVCGDFNEIMYGFEKRGGLPRNERRMKSFRKTLEDCQLYDVGFEGSWFTWERGNLPNTNIRERLDRGVANLGWISIFSRVKAQHLIHTFSDHCPILIGTTENEARVQNSIFRFEAWWLIEDSFIDVVKGLWEKSSGELL
ncbi:hypothetical protein Goklo_025395 [Gossypium klotzschianum]|uniref:Endonuclease/exonuclease/phosphatase domain-containing protein n=1 Tax=Gossypium klotzschianum TaxID=34286 RepID=A0A7J8W9V9_9ROSI|nr:hypothetical protein [Gossypium klotzschianum]